jgi:DNA-damage-inducible protein J
LLSGLRPRLFALHPLLHPPNGPHYLVDNYSPNGLLFFKEVIIMAKISTVRARIEPELKADVEKLFKELGISTTEAINLFYRQVKLRNGFPFNVVIPNKTTEKVFKDTDAKRNLIRCEDADDLFEKLGI